MKRQVEKRSKDSLAVYWELRFKATAGTVLTAQEYDRVEDKLNQYIIKVLRNRTNTTKTERIILPQNNE